ncbi:MAG: FAD-dependent oxidoreductase [Pirellulaceae bacterium]|nr:FAD-dependent oxidoreductase [Pirellulaceae bacterium]
MNQSSNSQVSAPGSVVSLGGGLIGVASAAYLSQDGWQVTVIDRGTIGGACSFGNCGLVCPSHVLPLTEPGALKSAFKALMTPTAPFRIKPRLDPSMWSWMLSFARRCNTRDMLSAAHAIQPLLASSMDEYQRMFSSGEFDCEWEKRGLLFAYQTRAALNGYDDTNRLLAETFNEPATKLDADATIAMEPALKPGIAGGWYYEHDGHLRPDRLMQAWRAQLSSRGVTFIEQCELRDFAGDGKLARQAQTSSGGLKADRFLIATGAWTPKLDRLIGRHIPIEPGKGYSITMPRPKCCPRIPLIFPEHRVAVTPMQTGYRLGSIMEFAGYDETIRPERLDLLRQGASHYLHEPHCEPELQTWFGWRPMTYDSLPIIGRVPRFDNVWLAAGHNMLGLTMAPATGKLVAELFAGRTPHLDPKPYGLERL